MGVRNRQKEPDIALVVVIDKSGSMDACHCNTFDGGMGGGGNLNGVQEDRHRQGGDPPGRGRAVGARRVRGRGLRRIRPLGHQHQAPRGCRRRRRPARARSRPSARRTSSPASSRRSGRSRTPSATRRHIILLTDGWSIVGRVRRDHRPHEGGRDHALDRRRRRWLEPLPRAAREEARRPLLQRRERQLDPRHLPQGDAAGRRAADRRGDVLPDRDQQLPDHPGPRGRLPAAPRLQRHDDQVRGAAGARVAARRPAPRPVAVRARAVRGLDIRLDRAAGPRTGSLAGLQAVLQRSSWRGRSRATRRTASRRRSRRVGGQTRLHVESVEADGSPRDFYNTLASITGPDFTTAQISLDQVAPGVYEANLGEITSGAYAVRITQMRSGAAGARANGGPRGAGRGRVPAPRRQPAPAAALRGATGGREIVLPTDPWLHDLTTTSSFTELWPWLLVLAAAAVAARRRPAPRLAGTPRAGRRAGVGRADAGALGAPRRRARRRPRACSPHGSGPAGGAARSALLRKPADQAGSGARPTTGPGSARGAAGPATAAAPDVAPIRPAGSGPVAPALPSAPPRTRATRPSRSPKRSIR